MSSALTSLIRVFPELVDLGSCVDRSRRRPATMQGWGGGGGGGAPPPPPDSDTHNAESGEGEWE